MSDIRIQTSFNLDLEFEAPPFHQRLLAWLIDIFVLIFYLIVAYRFLNWISADEANPTRVMALVLLLIIPFFTYHLICEATMNGQSIGKKILGIRVVNENGSRPSYSQFVIRWLIRTSDFMALVFILGANDALQRNNLDFFWKAAAAFGLLIADVILVNTSKKHQRLGDLLGHTILIRTRQRTSIDDTVFLQIGPDYMPSFPQVMQLSDRDINALKNILKTAKRHNDRSMAAHAAEKIQNHLNIQTSLDPYAFLEVLLKDYNYLATQ
ncbi:RDD family protein [Paraflavisolibacter sp. H34]|uniref:RDD family protein n=1 Tax=Huijunlia imazamoxiresistens TaxID=3127457 RepID=UPI0030163BF0